MRGLRAVVASVLPILTRAELGGVYDDESMDDGIFKITVIHVFNAVK